MIKKLLPGLVAVLIALASLLGSSGSAFAATGGASLSKWFFTEADEYGFMRDPDQYSKITAPQWVKLDAFFDTDIPANVGNYNYYHIFDRRSYYSNGALTSSYDFHYLVRVLKSYNAEPKRSDGRLYMISKSTLDKVPYQNLQYFQGYYDNNVSPTWDNQTVTTGLIFTNTADRGDITIFEPVTATTKYDPASPPAYAQPGYTAPSSGEPQTPEPTDPDFPVQPTPPDNNWDLIGWVKYIVDWIIYLVKCFVYFLRSFGEAIGEVVTGAASLIEAMTDFLAFLPNQVMTIVSMGVVAMIIVGIVKK